MTIAHWLLRPEAREHNGRLNTGKDSTANQVKTANGVKLVDLFRLKNQYLFYLFFSSKLSLKAVIQLSITEFLGENNMNNKLANHL